MATVKEYETLVKKVAGATGDERAELVKQKHAVADALRSRAATSKDRRASLRKLKFALDEANNQ